MRPIRSFTLIELLIVIAIMAILATIAVGNLLLGQTRSKVARAQADMRTLSLGVEAYAVDRNAYPRMAHWRFYADPALDIIAGEKVQGVLSAVLSTPVAYVGKAFLMDEFMKRQADLPLDERMYTYQVLPLYVQEMPESPFWPLAETY